jgi:hypothetical protein
MSDAVQQVLTADGRPKGLADIAVEQRGGAKKPRGLFDGIEPILPLKTLDLTIGGHGLHFEEPVTARFLAAGPHFQKIWDQMGEATLRSLFLDATTLRAELRALQMASPKTEKETIEVAYRIGVIEGQIETLGGNQSGFNRQVIHDLIAQGPTLMLDATKEIAVILDILLGKSDRLEPELQSDSALSWCANNLKPSEIEECVQAFIRVIPYEVMKRLFFGIAGAIKGHIEAARK